MHKRSVRKLTTPTKMSSFKTILRLLKEMDAKASVWTISLLFAIFSSAILAFSSFALGYIVQAIFITTSTPNDDSFMVALKNLSPLLLILILFLMYLAISVLTYLQNIIMVKISQNACSRLRWETYCRLQKMPISYFDTHPSGDLMSRLTNDIDNVSQALIQSASQIIQGVFTVFFIFVILMAMSPTLTLISVTMLVIMLVIGIWFTSKAQPYFIKQQDRIGDLNGYMEEMLSGHKVVALLNRQNEVNQKFDVYNEAIVPSAVKAQTLAVFIFPWFGFASNLIFLLFVIIAAVFMNNNIPSYGFGTLGHGSIAFVMSFISLLRSFTSPIMQLLSVLNLVQAGIAGAQRAFTILDLVPPQDKDNAIELSDIKGNVEFKNVNFGYTSKALNLKNANIKAKSGEVIAIVGPTGAGKTTIINLLTKFYRYNDGFITIDEKEISDVKETSWRDQISIVLQDTYLFTSTIKENIRYGNLKASDDEIIEAAKVANAHDFIMQLKDGYDSVVESNGRNFSQGQKQLLAIARAVIRKTPILLLDEATSSVDTRTEVQIQKALNNLMLGKTSFVIAHRLSTIKNANKILVVNNGEIIEQGSHDELLKLNGFYSNLYHSQFKKGSGGEFELD
ncbi:ABC transporter ATP-binding protein [Mycoplasmoides alvi]|uniref:ABC transporter ATP-binding protein n=1 Tax=Mycoplasmoides alvi TaxID=78580 RepID=UPI000696AFBB|nr:ABC transporter ATP-binding protein [Mycoplasmoides alvi]